MLIFHEEEHDVVGFPLSFILDRGVLHKIFINFHFQESVEGCYTNVGLPRAILFIFWERGGGGKPRRYESRAPFWKTYQNLL